ncbi:right-handed parallel beta-helix repeat-containing protein [Flagellimonas sp. CMM7]|uniref:right-handed parallel beta-helix repeat-containing protein n=1 Tax=Flagellimonas sp. CMM7 TaxID=2654676 RepID=UPI0013D5CA6A|nr:right-handed parallel beta-helix repeat-containing protein [Flagellimonas sp. CMM7]UII79855.1 right-handed parallel beta-helix repeat-containing protein [Flagellimonas sp. CMM7]
MKNLKFKSVFIAIIVTIITINHSFSQQSNSEKNIVYVNSNLSSNGDGTSWKSAFNSLETALAKAKANTEIWVTQGTYVPERKVTGNQKRDFSFQLKNNISLLGGFKGTELKSDERNWKENKTILSGDLNKDDETDQNLSDNCFHVVTGNGTNRTAIIDGFIITGGNANMDEWPNDGGGGMNIEEGSPTIKNCIVTNNKAFADGAGIRVWGDSNPTISFCLFSKNQSVQEGGGLMNGPGSHTKVFNCIFKNNKVGEDGAGMYNNETTNQVIANCLFYNNEATLTGGGMYNVNGSAPLIVNCTFVNNVAKEVGGGMSNRDSNPKLRNCILWGNTAPKNMEINDLRSTPDIAYSIVSGGYNGTNIIDSNPNFKGNGFELTDKSPAINSGTNSVFPEDLKIDLNGKDRIIDDAIDLGAYEFKK